MELEVGDSNVILWRLFSGASVGERRPIESHVRKGVSENSFKEYFPAVCKDAPE